VNTGLAYGCKALLYFTYFTPTDAESNFHNGILDAKGKRTPHFGMAKAINAELKNLSSTLVRLTSTAVYHTAQVPAGCTKLPNDATVQAKSDVPLVLGFFRHDDGSQWILIVNRDLHKAAATTLTFDPKFSTIEELSPQDGKLDRLAVSNQTARCDIPAGGIKILKLAR
jgi:hypothetical protein